MMENIKTPKTRRRSSDVGLKRLSSSKLDKLDEFFKSPGLSLMGKKRKRHRTDEDTLSLNSVDLHVEEPKKKRRSSLARVTSLANIFSPIKPAKRVSHVFQRSFSLRNLVSPNAQKPSGTPYKRPGSATPGTPLPKRRLSTYWHETVNDNDVQKLNKAALDRQEAIYELYKGEEELIEDLSMVKKTYHDSMKKLGLLSEDESDQIFGPIDQLIPLHRDLVDALREQRHTDGTTHDIGQALLEWVPKLESYVSYCANQIYAKALLDVKKKDPAVDDFLQRCQDSPFSRKLDLWSFLDYPRSKLVKYPLLFRSIQKVTPLEHDDHFYLEKATQVVEKIIERVDHCAGQARCQFIKSKLEYLDDKQRHPLIEESKAIICDGILKNNRGTKLHVFLFDKIMVLTRLATRGEHLQYQMYRQPIPVSELVLVEEGEAKMGSFKSAFSHSQSGKNGFKISFLDSTKGQSHTLIPNDEHDKKQWLSSINSVLPSRTSEVREEADGQEDPADHISNTSGSSLTSLSSASSVPETEFL